MRLYVATVTVFCLLRVFAFILGAATSDTPSTDGLATLIFGASALWGLVLLRRPGDSMPNFVQAFTMYCLIRFYLFVVFEEFPTAPFSAEGLMPLPIAAFALWGLFLIRQPLNKTDSEAIGINSR